MTCAWLSPSGFASYTESSGSVWCSVWKVVSKHVINISKQVYYNISPAAFGIPMAASRWTTSPIFSLPVTMAEDKGKGKSFWYIFLRWSSKVRPNIYVKLPWSMKILIDFYLVMYCIICWCFSLKHIYMWHSWYIHIYIYMYMHEFALALLLLVFTERCKEAMHGIGMHVSMTAILGNVFSMN